MAGIDQVKSFLAQHGLEVLEFEVPTPTVETAAAAVGCDPAEIAKSILLLIGKSPLLVVACGDRKVNSSLLKKAAGLSGKVTMPTPEQVLQLTGYPPGGVCPFLMPDELPVLLDLSLQRFPTIYPAGGNRFSAVPIDYQNLQQLTSGREVDVTLPLES